jgi:hypothetical protein
MNHRSRPLLFPALALLVMQSMVIAAQAAAHPRDQASWSNLTQLVPGAEVKVVLRNKKSYQSKFQSLGDEAIVVAMPHSEQSFERQNVLRVSTRGKSHRLRNTLVGAAVGAGAGVGFAGLADAEDYFHFSMTNQNYKIFIPSFTVVGAIVGAALPTGRWRVVYRSR